MTTPGVTTTKSALLISQLGFVAFGWFAVGTSQFDGSYCGLSRIVTVGAQGVEEYYTCVGGCNSPDFPCVGAKIISDLGYHFHYVCVCHGSDKPTDGCLGAVYGGVGTFGNGHPENWEELCVNNSCAQACENTAASGGRFCVCP